jgi:hypothetical protein
MDHMENASFKKIINSNHNVNIFVKLPLLFLLCFIIFPSLSFADGVGRGDNFKGLDARDGYYYGGDSFQGAGKGSNGNEATGVLAAFLLILANLTVFISLILKGMNRYFSLQSGTKESINNFNRLQKKHLKAFHYFLNPIAIVIAVVHFNLSSCRSILPDLGLVLFLIIGIFGVILKLNLSPKNIYRALYGFHCSAITFIALILLLAMGHG